MKVLTLVSGQTGSKTDRTVITGIIHFNHYARETMELVLLPAAPKHLKNSQTFAAHTDTRE